jgi:hypothetical protein
MGLSGLITSGVRATEANKITGIFNKESNAVQQNSQSAAALC